jgi:hypothetical protein
MDENRNKNAHTNMMIARLQRELEETKDKKRMQEIQKEMNNLLGGLSR